MADRVAQLKIQLGAVEDHLFRMHRFDCVQRYREFARVLDVDHELRAAIRFDRADRAEFLAAIGNEGLETYFDFLLHDLLLPAAPLIPASMIATLPRKQMDVTCGTPPRRGLSGFGNWSSEARAQDDLGPRCGWTKTGPIPISNPAPSDYIGAGSKTMKLTSTAGFSDYASVRAPRFLDVDHRFIVLFEVMPAKDGG
ncbi:MAG: hypothetical protein ACREQR_11075 [Candidatus Binataceae bacterium]